MKFSESKYLFNYSSQLGISYERHIDSKSIIGATYNQWTNAKQGFMPINWQIPYAGNVANNCYASSFGEKCIAKIALRSNYKMVDFYLGKQCLSKCQKYGIITPTIGLSYTWGENLIIDTVIFSTVPPFDNIETKSHIVNQSYIGVIPKIKYSITLLKNKIILGAYVDTRKYINLKEVQFDLGIFVGYNF